MSRTILEEKSGHEFEEIMMDVFRNLGYEDVRNPSKTGDMGRDIIMEKEGENGEKITYIAECKHYSNTKVGRPVIQKLDSACRSYETSNDKQGMVVTTNRFSRQAEEYAEDVGIELMNGEDIRDLAEEAGLNIYNGNVEIICNKSVYFESDVEILKEDVVKEFQSVDNFQEDYIDEYHPSLDLIPFVRIRSEIYSTYRSDSVGLVNKISESQVVYHGPDAEDSDKVKEIYTDSTDLMEFDRENLEEKFESLEIGRFDASESDIREEHRKNMAETHVQNVSYTAGNNVTYHKTHEPDEDEVDITSFQPVYIPKMSVKIDVKDYEYTVEYLKGGGRKTKVEDESKRNFKGEKVWRPAMCPYCGSINRKRKLKTERLEHKPICTLCSVEDRYWLKKRYFKDQDNHERFNQIYQEMSIPQKLYENKLPVAALGLIVTAIVSAIIGM